MIERCRSCREPLPENWPVRMCQRCSDKERAPDPTPSVVLAKARKPGECGQCGVPLLSDERERGTCGACVKKSRHTLVHPRGHKMDSALPPTVAGWVKDAMDLFDNERRPGSVVKDWELGYATFTRDLGNNSHLVVLQLHVNGGKEVVVWRQGDEVSLLRFDGGATDGFKPGADEFLVMPNGMVVQGAVARMHDVMTGREVNTLIQRNRERILQPKHWSAGKFRRRHSMIVCTLTRDGRLSAPEVPAIAADMVPQLTVDEDEEETL